MSSPIRACLLAIAVAVIGAPGTTSAGTLVGRVELPPAPERPPVAVKGFLDRAENPLANIRQPAVAPFIIVALEGEPKPASDPPQVKWDLAGDSFSPPVIAAQVNANVVITNLSRAPRTLVAAEDPKLIPPGPVNPTGPKSFRVTDAKVYTIGDKDAAHLKGRLVVVNTPYVTTVDNTGKFQFEAPPGSYKLHVFYRDSWTKVEETVNIPAKGRAPEVVLKGLVSPKK
jgi:hypothetical protein